MIPIAEAWARIAARAQPLEVVSMTLEEGAGRVLAAAVSAPMDLPPFDRSAMDGYAVRAAEVASPGARLRYVGDVPAGSVYTGTLGAGQLLGISTGAQIPDGADAVVMVEDTERAGDDVIVGVALSAGDNIRRRGEDIAAGSQLLAAGVRLSGPRLGLLAGSGITSVAVHRRPRVGVLMTGSELVAAGQPLPQGSIYESNSITLHCIVREAHAEVVALPTVADDPEALSAAIAEGLRSCDVLLTTGGVSVGQHDLVRNTLETLGAETVFWKVALKPGKPILCCRHEHGWAFGLPGNPLSVVAGFHVFVAPLLRVLDGEPSQGYRTLPARLLHDASPARGRTTFSTVTLSRAADGVLQAGPAGPQGSAMTKSLADADAFAIIEPDAGVIPAGSTIEVLPLGPIP